MRVSKKHKKESVELFSIVNVVLGLLIVFGLSACSQQESAEPVVQVPVHIHDGQECDLCGMIISEFPGPKGQLFTRGNKHPLAFCSTRDMFAYALQPEHKHRVQSIFVHDVATAEWSDMSSAKYVDATSAFYVVGHSQLGAMGPTLAAFSDRTAAEHFTHHFGGEVKTYEEIDQTVLNSMNHMDMQHSSMDMPSSSEGVSNASMGQHQGHMAHHN